MGIEAVESAPPCAGRRLDRLIVEDQEAQRGSALNDGGPFSLLLGDGPQQGGDVFGPSDPERSLASGGAHPSRVFGMADESLYRGGERLRRRRNNQAALLML